MNAVRTWRDQNCPGEGLVYRFEHGDSGQGEIVRTLRMLKLEDAFDIAFVPKRVKRQEAIMHCYPFQACDFIAYEAAKASRTLLEQDARAGALTTEMRARQSLSQIIPKSRDITWRFIDSGLLGEMCRRLHVKRRQKSVTVRFTANP